MTTTNENKLMSYSREIVPMARSIAEKKEALKDILEGDEEVAEHQRYVNDAKEALDSAILENEEYQKAAQALKELVTEFKQAVKGAAKGTDYKPAELTAYFNARAKDKAVEKTINKGELFVALNEELEA